MINKIMITTAMIALATILATMTVAQMVVAQSDNSLACQNGNAYACGVNNGNPATRNPDSGTITQCQHIPGETPLCPSIRVY